MLQPQAQSFCNDQIAEGQLRGTVKRCQQSVKGVIILGLQDFAVPAAVALRVIHPIKHLCCGYKHMGGCSFVDAAVAAVCAQGPARLHGRAGRPCHLRKLLQGARAQQGVFEVLSVLQAVQPWVALHLVRCHAPLPAHSAPQLAADEGA